MNIYITDLAAYNNGHLVGKWVTLPCEDVWQEVAMILTEGTLTCHDGSMHEEHFITDFECDYMDIEEYEDLDKLNEIAEKMQDLDDDQIVAVKLMLENSVVNDLDDAIEHLDDMRNTGETNMENVAINYVDECGLLETMPENLRFYFDYAALGRDMEIEGSYFEDNDGFLWEYAA